MQPEPVGELLTGATVLAPQPQPPGTAVATLGERILAVGPDEACRAALTGAGATDPAIRDLTGTTLVPGFVDAHLHPMVMCVFEEQLLLDEVASVPDVCDRLADRARVHPGTGALIGFQLDGELLVERRLPTAAELDAAVGDREVVLLCRDRHRAVASSAALRSAGLIDAASGTASVPDGGRVAFDVAGRPTGLVGERAVEPLMALMPEITIDGLVAGLASWSDRLLRQGVTSISAMCQTTAEGPAGPAGELEAFGWAALSDDLPFDIQTILITPEPHEAIDRRDPALHDPSRCRRMDAVKLFLDGTLGGRTACMHHAFSDAAFSDAALSDAALSDAGDAHSCGLRTTDDDEAFRRMESAHLAGLQICIHAIGDAANHAAAELLQRLLRRHPGTHRHRVEHASVLDDWTVEAFAELAVTAVVQPINLRSEAHWLARRVGAQRLERTYALRTMTDAGIVLAGSSDAPIERTDVLAAMAAATSSPVESQRLTRGEALAAFTTGSSRARMTEGHVGTIAAGARADLVVLDSDPTDPRTDLDDVVVLSTTVAGATHRWTTEAARRPTGPSSIRHPPIEERP